MPRRTPFPFFGQTACWALSKTEMRTQSLVLICMLWSVAACQDGGADLGVEDASGASTTRAPPPLLAEVQRATEMSKDADVVVNRVPSLPTVRGWPTATDLDTVAWYGNSLVLEMPRGASFQLSVADGNFPPCGVHAGQSGGVAALRRNGVISEYGCWWAFERPADKSGWAKLQMRSGIEFVLPLRAFDKRPTQW